MLAAILLIILSPLFLLISLGILRYLGKPIFFTQKRPGYKCRPFKLIKFRSMTNKVNKSGTLLSDSDRLNNFGKWLRSTSIDELPALINIIRGEMSFIGPRPALHNQIDLIEYRTKDGIHNMKPGITGWAQVNGRDELSIPEKVSFERDYMNQRSLSFDVYIIWLTLLKVIRNDGISH